MIHLIGAKRISAKILRHLAVCYKCKKHFKSNGGAAGGAAGGSAAYQCQAKMDLVDSQTMPLIKLSQGALAGLLSQDMTPFTSSFKQQHLKIHALAKLEDTQQKQHDFKECNQL